MMPRRKQGRSQESAEGEPSETSSDADSKLSCSPPVSTLTDESQSETVVVRRRKTGVVFGPRGIPAFVGDWTDTVMTASRGEVQPESLVGGGPIVSTLPCSGQRKIPTVFPQSRQTLSALGSVYGFKSTNIETVLEGLKLSDASKRAGERSKSFSGILSSEAELGSVTRASSLHTLSGYAISRPPKLTNPQVIEQHISKIISENAAIVETLDPLWSKRYMRHNGEAKTRRMSEGAAAFPSKLHSALLRGRTGDRRSPLRESGVKNVTEDQCKQHPHNPEGSIIKDLLLKARAQLREEGEATDIEPGQVVYTCSLCSITFRSRENLEVHQAHYCKGAGSPLQQQQAKMPVSKRSSSFSYPGFFPRDEPGQILKKQLLGAPQAEASFSPHKKRKISEPVFSNNLTFHSSEAPHRENRYNVNSPFWNKPIPSPSCSSADNQEPCDLVATIAKPVLNSGGALFRASPDPVSQPSEANTSSVVVSLGMDKTELPLITVIDVNGNNSFLPKDHKSIPEVRLTPSSPDPVAESKCETDSGPPKNYLSPARPTSLPLKKKAMTMEYSTIVSPETPRPKRNFYQVFLNGQAYTSLYLKCSTRSTYCCLRPPQPMYVPHQSKLSMYSNWQVQPAKEDILGLSPGQSLSLYDSSESQQRRRGEVTTTTIATSKASLVSTHSSYWTFRQTKDDLPEARKQAKELRAKLEPPPTSSADEAMESSRDKEGVEDDKTLELGMEKDCPTDDHTSAVIDPGDLDNDSNDNLPEGDSEASEGGSSEDSGSESIRSDQPVGPRGTTKRVRIFQGGFKSNEDYTYIRGRGRGKYVCEECGIRCKKPSMLKKHIRTHTDLRPYSCSHCSFAFKTKGNLTKHMKSKAHHKKCLELGIVPVPTVIDDSQIDEAALAKQVANRQQFLDTGEIDDEDDDEDEDFDEDEEDEESEFEEEEEGEDSPTGQKKKEPEPSKGDSSSNGVVKKPGGQFEDANSCSNSIATTAQVIQTVCQPLETFPSSGPTPIHSVGQPSEMDQEAEAARSLLNLSDAWMANGPAEPEKKEEVSRRPPATSAISSPSLVGIPRVVWSPDQDQGPKSRPRSYSVNVPPSRDPHTKVISYALPAVSEECVPDHGYTNRRYSMSALNESRRVILNCPSSSSMYSRSIACSEKNLNHKESELYGKHWPMTNGGEQPIDLRVSKAPRLMLLAPQQTLWNNNSVLLSPVNEHHSERSLMDGSRYGVPYLENVSSPSEYSSISVGRYSPNSSGRLNVDAFPVQDPEEMNGEIIEAPMSPEVPEYSALSPISPASVDGDSQPSAATLDEMTAMAVMDSKVEMSARQVVFNRMNNSKMEEGKCVCSICNKTFSKPSQLRLHVNIHYFERPFRCESCAVSFRTKGHLQKHKRSVSHYNKVNMNMTFGTPTTDNPRPFKCGDCKIAFRIHGHLAKHLRSKMHIMKLECLGKLPFGMYAEMERSGVNLNEIDTTDCENSLESLQVMAHRLYQQEPRRMRWQSDHQSSTSGKEDKALNSPPTHVSSDEALGSPPVHSRVVQVSLPATSLNPAITDTNPKAQPLKALEVKLEPSEEEILRLVQQTQEDYGPPPSKISATDLSRVVTVEKELEAPVLHRSCTCHLCGRLFKSMKFLQVHLHYDHQGWSVPSEPTLDLVVNTITVDETSEPQLPPQRWASPLDCNQRLLGGSAAIVENLNCEICGRQFISRNVLQQHLLSHAQLRPFVCEVCDAGFTSSVMLSAHLASHSQEKPYMCHECGNTFAVAADFQRHMQAHLNDAT